MKLTEKEILDRIERIHVYEGHDYPVIRILVDDGSGEHIAEDEYEQILKKFREWKEDAKKWNKYKNSYYELKKKNMINLPIVERLKKRIEELEILRKSIDGDFVLEPHEEKTLDYLQELQKILDGKK